jgi:predicted acylesterase/phospholipase RssA
LLEKFSKEMNSSSIKRKFTVGVTDATNIKSLSFDIDKETNKTKILDLIIASTSMPFVFPYQKHNDSIYVDGGVLLNVDARSAIRRCKEIVDDEKDIIVDAIMPTGDSIR